MTEYARTAEINLTTGIVENVFAIDSSADLSVSSREGYVYVRDTQVQAGDTWDIERGFTYLSQVAMWKPPTKAELLAYAANARWVKETGGVTWNGHLAYTDINSQTKYIAEFVAIQAGLRTDPSPWKFGDSFVSVSNADFATLVATVRNHVEGSFAIEGTLANSINSGTVTSFEEIDAAFV